METNHQIRTIQGKFNNKLQMYVWSIENHQGQYSNLFLAMIILTEEEAAPSKNHLEWKGVFS